ncbi:MAG: XrtA/PEP-CTERM system histidine kinase PrsK [Gallionella sp.]
MLSSIAVFSYAIAAVAFLALFVLLLTSWRGRMHGMALTVSCLLTALWASTVAFVAASGNPWTLLTDILEILRNAGWSVFVLMLLGYIPQTKTFTQFMLKPYVVAIASLYLLLSFATVYSYWQQDFPRGELVFMTGIVGRVALAVIGMLLVEQLYRNTPVKNRWGIKFACLGVGGLFAYDFYLYSDAMLFRHINADIWAARGVVDALTVPLMAMSAARNPQWSLEISVSRRIIFHTAALFGSAIYLLVMAAAGYYIRFFGGSWGAVLQLAFLFGAVILLVGILFSGIFRSWLKVFISKNFYSYNYDYREEWLRFTRTLAKHGYGLGERAIQAVAELVESPGGVLFIRRESGDYEFVTRWNISLTSGSEPHNSSFCQFLENKQWVIDLQEYNSNPEKYGAISIPQWLRDTPQARLVVPLVLHGKLFGFVVLAHPRSKIKLNWEVIDLLKIAGSQAASFLAQQESDNALMVSRQFDSFNRMSTFVVHDLKNLVSQLSLLLSNASVHKNNPEFQKDMMETVDLSIHKMKRLLEKLSSGTSMKKPVPLLIENVLQKVVDAKSAVEPKPKLEIQDHGLEVLADWANLERVIGHLIQNAIEATPKDGLVLVRLTKGEGNVLIEVQDTGHGMSEEFIHERLFKPFESTKSAGMGIGVFECQEYAKELGGRLEVVSSQSSGTTFLMTLPCHKPDSMVQNSIHAQENIT